MLYHNIQDTIKKMNIEVEKNKNHNQFKKTDIDSEITQMLKLAHKDFKTSIINLFKDLREKMDTISKQMEIISKEIETIHICVLYMYVTIHPSIHRSIFLPIYLSYLSQ